MIIISSNPLLLRVQVWTSSMGLIPWALVGNGLSGAAADPRSRSLHSNKIPGGSGTSLRGSVLHYTDDTNRQRATRHHWPRYLYSQPYFSMCPPGVANHMLTDLWILSSSAFLLCLNARADSPATFSTWIYSGTNNQLGHFKNMLVRLDQTN